jgi:hypothetical protein
MKGFERKRMKGLDIEDRFLREVYRGGLIVLFYFSCTEI